ncbi:MAG: phage tail sheath C-terminal domain-containing protein [Bacteroidota bacterium]
MATYKVPGIKIKEKRVFGKSVPTNDTAIPVFIGYTKKNPKGVHKVSSMKEFKETFGQGDLILKENGKKKFFFQESLFLYFENGGGSCYVISVGGQDGGGPRLNTLEKGLDHLPKIQAGNLVIVPDAASLSLSDKGKFYNSLLERCVELRKNGGFVSQFAILDAGRDTEKYTDEKEALDQISGSDDAGDAGDKRDFGAMYHPWLRTSFTHKSEISSFLLNEDNLLGTLEGIGVIAQANDDGNNEPQFIQEYLQTAYQQGITHKEWERLLKDEEKVKDKWMKLLDKISEINNTIPPSGAVAGVFSRSDSTYGIQKAPANMILKGVIETHTLVTDADQREFNVPHGGKSINCIRTFVNNGIKIWGARTLNGESDDYRYVNVRRTMNMLQSSIKALLENFVFADNNERTWLKIRTSLNKFLKTMLSRGILYGSTPSEAFDFSVGLGETMTQDDVLNGLIRVEIRVALIRPAEFIEIVFEQKSMEGASTEEVAEGGDA